MDDNVLEDNIIIDPEFSAMIPPLSHEERQQLEVNLVEHGGARDPIVVWMLEEWTPDGCDNSLQIDDYKLDGDGDGRTWKIWDDPDDDENEPYYLEEWPCILLDGHNRYEICTRLGLPFDIHRLRFKSREEAADWIDKNQLGRRNLDPTQMSLLRGRRYNRTKKAVGGDGTNQHSEECGQNVHKARTAESLAAEHGVNEKTIRRDGEFAKAVETLGIERDVVSGAIDAPKYQIVEAARSLPQNPTPEEVQRVVEMVRTQSYIAKPSDEPSQEPRWREDEEQRRVLVQAGQSVLANFHRDLNLIEWASRNGVMCRIDRNSIWGNPFVLPADGDRPTVIDHYRWYLDRKPSLLKQLPQLHGKVLACWCYPDQCHGHVLLEKIDDHHD